MEGAVFLAGRMGAGKNTLLTAQLNREPQHFRCLTAVTNARPWGGAVHPENKSWSEFSYLGEHMFDFLVEGDHFAVRVEDAGISFGVLHTTLLNVVQFDGCVIANYPVTFFEDAVKIFAVLRRTLIPIFLDAPEDVLFDRMIRRGNTRDEAHEHMRISCFWREQALDLGFTIIENPEDRSGYPFQAEAAFLKEIGWQKAALRK